MGAEKRLLPIKEAFQLAQQPHQNQAKLVVALSRTYLTVSMPDPLALGRCCPPSRASLDSPDSSLLKPSRPGSEKSGDWPKVSGALLLSPAASGADR